MAPVAPVARLAPVGPVGPVVGLVAVVAWRDGLAVTAWLQQPNGMLHTTCVFFHDEVRCNF